MLYVRNNLLSCHVPSSLNLTGDFLILLGNTDSKSAAAVAERLRKCVESLTFGQQESHSLTISLGSAVLNKEETPSALTLRADQALYRAKTTGRNCSVLA